MQPPAPDTSTEPDGKLPRNAKILLADALAKVADPEDDEGRNDVGAWLGEQLRDHGFVDIGESVLLLYQRSVERWKADPYTAQAARDTWRSVLTRPAREGFLPAEPDDLEQELASALDLTQGEDERRDYTSTALTDEDLFALAPPDWLVDEFLPAEGVVVVWGQPGIGKTFLALDMALEQIAHRKPRDGQRREDRARRAQQQS